MEGLTIPGLEEGIPTKVTKIELRKALDVYSTLM